MLNRSKDLVERVFWRSLTILSDARIELCIR